MPRGRRVGTQEGGVAAEGEGGGAGERRRGGACVLSQSQHTPRLCRSRRDSSARKGSTRSSSRSTSRIYTGQSCSTWAVDQPTTTCWLASGIRTGRGSTCSTANARIRLPSEA
eukprot:3606709-Prymnesium_polylepis.1